MPIYQVTASTPHATYNAGRFYAESREEAIRQAQEDYEGDPACRRGSTVGAFRWTAQKCRTAEEETG